MNKYIKTQEPELPEDQYPDHAEEYRKLIENVEDIKLHRDGEEITGIREFEIREESNGAGIHLVVKIDNDKKEHLHEWTAGDVVVEFVFPDKGWLMTRTCRATDLSKDEYHQQSMHVFWERDVLT